MTNYKIPDEAMEYFVLRDTLAQLLGDAGVKKHSRSAVAEILIDAGVIDVGLVLQEVGTQEEDEAHEWKVGDRAVWNGTHGRITAAVPGLDSVTFRADGRETERDIPADWLAPEEASDEA